MTLKVRGEEYVTAAVMMGASTWTILRRHIIPNILPLVVTTGALDIGAIMIEVAGLSSLVLVRNHQHLNGVLCLMKVVNTCKRVHGSWRSLVCLF